MTPAWLGPVSTSATKTPVTGEPGMAADTARYWAGPTASCALPLTGAAPPAGWAATADQRASKAAPVPSAAGEEFPLTATIRPPISPMRTVSCSSTV